jgi:hypothetical protein
MSPGQLGTGVLVEVGVLVGTAVGDGVGRSVGGATGVSVGPATVVGTGVDVGPSVGRGGAVGAGSVTVRGVVLDTAREPVPAVTRMVTVSVVWTLVVGTMTLATPPGSVAPTEVTVPSANGALTVTGTAGTSAPDGVWT